MSLTYILMYHPHIYVFGGFHVAYIHLDLSSTYIRYWWGPCHLHTSWCIIHIYTFFVRSMSLTYILMYHPHIYVFGGVHVTYIHLDVSSTYIRLSWGPCRLHTSWCIIHIYTFLVEYMSLTYILMYHPHIYVFDGFHVAYIHLDVSSTYIRFWWGPCLLHTSWCIIHIYTFLVGSVLILFLVFCVVFLVRSVLILFLVFCVVFLVGSVLLLFLVFCVVFLVMSTLLISLVFCVVFFVLFVFVLCPVNLMLPVSLDCPFLVTPAAFSTVFWRGWTCCMRLNNHCFTKPYWF